MTTAPTKTPPATTTQRHALAADELPDHVATWQWTTITTGDRHILVTGHTVSAVELPIALASQVQNLLVRWHRAGPVIELPGTPRRWVILTESADNAPPVTTHRIASRGGIVHRDQALVPLPPSRLESGTVRWTTPPPRANTIVLPPLQCVVNAITSAAPPRGCPPSHGTTAESRS